MKICHLPFLFILVFLLSTKGFGQAPVLQKKERPRINQGLYQLSLKKDLPLAISGTGLAMAYLFYHKDQSVDEDFILGLNADDINRFDRSATRNYSPAADKASDAIMNVSLVAPAFLMIDPKIRKDWKEISVITTETFIIGIGLTGITKKLVNRARPLAYNESLSIDDRIENGTLNSFMSGHTAATAMSTFMMATMIVHYHPDTRWKPLIWTLASGIPATTGMLRYKAGKHYFTDVLAGYTVGALTGYLIPTIHKKISTKRKDKSTTTLDYFGCTVLLRP
ncbi:MAG: phosphatase PAP2 family protein [Bacteroidetes bacterium]|nr:phosphatase PAP2 family protein [Bacteroidota bacterium]